MPPLSDEAGSPRGARLTPAMEGGGVRRGLKPMERESIDRHEEDVDDDLFACNILLQGVAALPLRSMKQPDIIAVMTELPIRFRG